MFESDVDATSAQDDDENDDVVLLRSAYRALVRLQTNLDNLETSLKKGEQSAMHHLAIAKANAKEALELVTQGRKIKGERIEVEHAIKNLSINSHLIQFSIRFCIRDRMIG